MARRLSENEWLELINNRNTIFGNHSGLFKACKEEFGTLNLFAIVGAANLVSSRGGRSRVEDLRELRIRMRQAQLEYHTNRFPGYNQLPEEEQGRIVTRSQTVGAIWNMGFGVPRFTMDEYLSAMDELNLWEVYFNAGASQSEEFEEEYPISPGLAELIAQQLHREEPMPESDEVQCCWHCGKAGHRAAFCPGGGSWSRTWNSQMARRGGRPRCFVCSTYASHSSNDCPYRVPESRRASYKCWNCHTVLQGRDRMKNTCWQCAEPLRCWNCGEGHRLKDCSQPRRAPGASGRGGQEAGPSREQRYGS